jgi:hypothetical protein
MLAPGDDMRPSDSPKRGGLTQPGEIDNLLHVDLVRTPCFFIGDIAEPFDFRGNVGELAELRGS